MNPEGNNKNKILDINISHEVKNSFLDYSMSVIISRALPDARDGLKPVHRRIIYAMTKLGIFNNGAYKKSARIVGEVIGKYHPHGDTSVYEAMVKMAQSFNYLHPLVEGQGNFGSVDGDNPAAMRYTEAKLAKLANFFIKDLEKNTVPFVENYDNSEKEPAYLPCVFPNLLVNGSYGIAVGLATNIPPHNLTEVIDAIIAQVKNENINIYELMEFIKGPDFPTQGIIVKSNGLYDAYKTGIGAIVLRAKTEIINDGKNKMIIVTEIPYRTNKAKLLEKIAELINKKEIMDISNISDETNRKGIRIVINLKKNSQPKVVLNKLFKLTQLQTSFTINMVALNKNKPQLLSLKELLGLFIEHYILLIVKRSKFEHNVCLKRIHILKGLQIALENIDNVIKIIKSSNLVKDAALSLEKTYHLDQEQIRAILEMKLQKLTNLEKTKITKELESLENQVKKLDAIINNKDKQIAILIKELTEIKNKYGKQRQTEIIMDDINIDDDALIKKEETVVFLSKNNYIKRMNNNDFSVQSRYGKGRSFLNKDFTIYKAISCSTLDDILFFTNKNVVYKLRAFQISKYESNKAKGLPLVNLLENLDPKEKITAMIAISKKDYDKNILFFTKSGSVKKTSLSFCEKKRSNGYKIFDLPKDNSIVNVALIDDDKKNSILAISKYGKMANTGNSKLRRTGKLAQPIKFLKITKKADQLIGGCSTYKSNKVILISEKGIGKLVEMEKVPEKQNRNITGVKVMSLNDKTGHLRAISSISPDEDLLIISKKGFVIRIAYNDIPNSSRTAAGNYLMKLDDDDSIELIKTLKAEK